MKQIGVGIIGFGTVGAGVVEGLLKNRETLGVRTGIDIVLKKIADLDITTSRGITVEKDVLTTDINDVIGNPEIGIVVELIGGCGIAKKVIEGALKAGQSVVTANKKLLAEHGAELFALAEENGVDLYFGASVGGGIPIIRSLREGLVGNRVESIFGILNGTCNYILTRMENENLSFDDALKAAQASGFAEADPTLDVDGFDTLHKACILAALAYGFSPDAHSLPLRGIRGVVSADDIRYAKELGYRIKLLAIVRNVNDEIELRVAPTLVPLDGMLASVSGVFNAAMVKCDLADTTLYYGRGAGRLPTASTVIGDIADVAFNRAHNAPLSRILPKSNTEIKMKAAGDVECRHYIRLAVKDVAGSVAKIAAVLAENGVSLASFLQKEPGKGTGDFVPVIILTHMARQAAIDASLAKIETLECCGAKPVSLGIEQ